MSQPNQPNSPPLSYLNPEFLKSQEARVIRILSEYLEPATRLRRHRIRDTIVFFGSARSVPPEQAARELELVKEGLEPGEETSIEVQAKLAHAEQSIKLARYYNDAMELARRVTEWSKGLTGSHHFIVCSGGSRGMMEAANRGASLARGQTIGLNIQLPLEQEVNQFVSRELIFNFHYFFMRKFWFVYPAKALVVFPGGFGTMDELFEVLTLIQTKKPNKTMPVILFGSEFWDEIINF
ncbi:MAG: LOG family protein, partial [Blastocatellia bacterium]